MHQKSSRFSSNLSDTSTRMFSIDFSGNEHKGVKKQTEMQFFFNSWNNIHVNALKFSDFCFPGVVEELPEILQISSSSFLVECRARAVNQQKRSFLTCVNFTRTSQKSHWGLSEAFLFYRSSLPYVDCKNLSHCLSNDAKTVTIVSLLEDPL